MKKNCDNIKNWKMVTCALRAHVNVNDTLIRNIWLKYVYLIFKFFLLHLNFFNYNILICVLITHVSIILKNLQIIIIGSSLYICLCAKICI